MAGITGVAGAALFASLFVTDKALAPWVGMAERWNPGLDAPDNWALGITYCVVTALTLIGLGLIVGLIGLIRSGKGPAKDKSLS